MQSFTARGLDLKYRQVGDKGPLVVLLHGFGGSVADWSSFLDLLNRKYNYEARFFIPSIKSFFSHHEPVTFSEQIDVLSDWIFMIQSKFGPKEPIHIIGTSYGATLGFGISLNMMIDVGSSVFINPMPFFPLKEVKNKPLRWIVGMGKWPKAIRYILRSPFGLFALKEVGQIFRMGLPQTDKIRHFNARKLLLVEKAISRFIWINQNEDWASWDARMKNETKGTKRQRHIVFSNNDPLFPSDIYLKTARRMNATYAEGVPYKGHLLVQGRPDLVAPAILQSLNHSRSS